jgi:hypothetical protein
MIGWVLHWILMVCALLVPVLVVGGLTLSILGRQSKQTNAVRSQPINHQPMASASSQRAAVRTHAVETGEHTVPDLTLLDGASAWLVDRRSRKRFSLHALTHIGRGEGNDIALPSDNRYVSRKHAQIRWDAERGCFVLLDLQSHNGTWLNGMRIVPLVPVPLRHGDEVRIEEHVFEFVSAREDAEEVTCVAAQ